MLRNWPQSKTTQGEKSNLARRWSGWILHDRQRWVDGGKPREKQNSITQIPESSSSCGFLERPSTSTSSFSINPTKFHWGYLSELDMFSQYCSYFAQLDHRNVCVFLHKSIVHQIAWQSEYILNSICFYRHCTYFRLPFTPPSGLTAEKPPQDCSMMFCL